MKILTKYVVKPFFYNLILWMIFWNMKYFFYNCLLLLLCCACCKLAIQIFVEEDRQQYNQNMQKNYSILPQSPTVIPTECDPSVFHRELQKNYSILQWCT